MGLDLRPRSDGEDDKEGVVENVDEVDDPENLEKGVDPGVSPADGGGSMIENES